MYAYFKIFDRCYLMCDLFSNGYFHVYPYNSDYYVHIAYIFPKTYHVKCYYDNTLFLDM